MLREKKPKTDSLNATILSTARGLHKNGMVDKRTYDRITKSLLGDPARPTAPTLTAKQIKALRAKAKMSQAVFADCLHLTVGHLSKLERGAESPKGPTLVLQRAGSIKVKRLVSA